MRQILFAVLLVISPFISFAQWNLDTLVRNSICTATKLQYEPQMCSDGHKGAIIVWADQRGSSQAIYAQLIDSTGHLKWASNGVLINLPATALSADYPQIVQDDNGGAIIFYNITISGGAEQIYAQHLDNNGNALWASGGVAIATGQDSRIRISSDASVNQIAASDNAGGAFITWQVYNPFNIYAQHIDKNGNITWAANGIQITSSDSTNAGYFSSIISTGSGTAVVSYNYNQQLWIQRLAADGSSLWGIKGVELATSFYYATVPGFLCFDSLSSTQNIMIGWTDQRAMATNGFDFYAQKLDLNGNILWQTQGAPVDTSAGNNTNMMLLADSQGGFFSTYLTTNSAKVQHTDQNANLLWGSTGIPVVSFSSTQLYPVIIGDAANGIIALWHDKRNASFESLYAQHFSSNGSIKWRQDGVPVIIGNVDLNHSVNPMVSYDKDVAIACWSDYRSGVNNNDIYAAKFGGSDGLLPIKLVSFTAGLVKDQVQIQWTTSQELNSSLYSILRSGNGRDYSSIATIPAQGNSSRLTTYSVIDPSPLEGLNYYKLGEIDRDGSISYSWVITVIRTEQYAFHIYPNPVNDIVTLDLNVTGSGNSIFKLFGSDGKLAAVKQAQLQSGWNQISWNISDLPKGIYFLKVDQSGFQVLKLIKK